MTSKIVPIAIGITIFLVLGSLVVIILPAISTSIFAAPSVTPTPTDIGELVGTSPMALFTEIAFTLMIGGILWIAASRI